MIKLEDVLIRAVEDYNSHSNRLGAYGLWGGAEIKMLHGEPASLAVALVEVINRELGGVKAEYPPGPEEAIEADATVGCQAPELLPCGHPAVCSSKTPDFYIGDDAATQRIGMCCCRWCADKAKYERDLVRLERELQLMTIRCCR